MVVSIVIPFVTFLLGFVLGAALLFGFHLVARRSFIDDCEYLIRSSQNLQRCNDQLWEKIRSRQSDVLYQSPCDN